MRSRAFAIAVAVVAVLLVGAGGVFAYDRSQAKEIGKGVRVGGVDVGGLTADEAGEKLRRAVLEPLRRPVVVRAEGHRFTLPPGRARLGVDVQGSVRAALARSREGNVLARAWRGVTGSSLDTDLALDITYSRKAVDRLVTRVSETVDREPVDASVDLAHGNVTPVESEPGRALMADRLRRTVRRRLQDPAAPRRVRARTRVLQPEVTTDELADKYPTILMVSRSTFNLTLYKRLKAVKTYGIAVGQVGLETPAGLYHIQNKAVDPAWSVPNSDWAGDLAGTVVPGGVPENPLKARWMGIYDGAGIHGTGDPGSIGSAASHGCIRMTIPDVVELYDQVPVGAPVYIS